MLKKKGRVRLLPWCALLLTLTAAPAATHAMNGGNAVGINVHVPAPNVVDLAADLGVQWVRMDNAWHLYDNACSPAMQFPARLDTAVKHAVQRGLHVFMGFGLTPLCASTGGRDDNTFNDPPAPAKYAEYVRRSVAHYRRFGVRHFGVWNEPNLSFFFEGTAEQYVHHVVLPGFSAVAKGCLDAGFDDCMVLGPDLAHLGDYDVFLGTVLDRMRAASAMFDIFTHHIYSPVATSLWDKDSFVNALDDRRLAVTRPSLIDVLNRAGLAPHRIPVFDIWITETGMRAEPPTGSQAMAEQAARYMEVLNVQAARSWYSNTMFYEILDPRNPEHAGFGIISVKDGRFFLKDAYLALQDRLATDARFSPNGPPPGYRPNATPTCARLGKSGFIRILDQDRFEFDGRAGELVTATLDRNVNGSHEGSRATLTLEGHGLFFVSRGPLFNDITVTLPDTGRYRIFVNEQFGVAEGAPFRGDYCLTLESSQNAHTTLRD